MGAIINLSRSKSAVKLPQRHKSEKMTDRFFPYLSVKPFYGDFRVMQKHILRKISSWLYRRPPVPPCLPRRQRNEIFRNFIMFTARYCYIAVRERQTEPGFSGSWFKAISCRKQLFCNPNHFLFNRIFHFNDMPRTFLSTDSASDALAGVYLSQIIFDFNCALGTVLCTDSASDTSDSAIRARLFALFFWAARNGVFGLWRNKFYYMLGTFLGAHSATRTFSSSVTATPSLTDMAPNLQTAVHDPNPRQAL